MGYDQFGNPTNNNDTSGSHKGRNIAIGVGVLLVLVLCAVGIWYIWFRNSGTTTSTPTAAAAAVVDTSTTSTNTSNVGTNTTTSSNITPSTTTTSSTTTTIAAKSWIDNFVSDSSLDSTRWLTMSQPNSGSASSSLTYDPSLVSVTNNGKGATITAHKNGSTWSSGGIVSKIGTGCSNGTVNFEVTAPTQGVGFFGLIPLPVSSSTVIKETLCAVLWDTEAIVAVAISDTSSDALATSVSALGASAWKIQNPHVINVAVQFDGSSISVIYKDTNQTILTTTNQTTSGAIAEYVPEFSIAMSDSAVAIDTSYDVLQVSLVAGAGATTTSAARNVRPGSAGVKKKKATSSASKVKRIAAVPTAAAATAKANKIQAQALTTTTTTGKAKKKTTPTTAVRKQP